jgi:membrane-bound lytic murein transglycosylase D
MRHWSGRIEVRRGQAVAAVVVGLAVAAAVAVPRPDTDPAAAPAPAPAATAPVAWAPAVAPPDWRTGPGPEWDLPDFDHPRVDYWVARFDSVPDMREKFQGFLDRGGDWAPMILERLEARSMPLDLLYLAMIESGFEPVATSHARAVGVWQFIAETGRRYGLAIDRAVDERRDPVRATDAALDYLQDLHRRFGSWYLAAAAYNTGEGRVGRIMRQQFGRERARSEADYYAIWDRLPRETRDYVPLMIAAARIAKDPAAWSFEPMRLEPRTWEHVTVPPATPLDRIARSIGASIVDIRMLNPHFLLDRTPNDRVYTVRLPAGSLDRLAAAGGPADWSLGD